MRLSDRYGFTLAFLLLGYFCLLIFIGTLIYLALTPVVPPARNVFSVETLPFIWPFLAVAVPFIILLSVGSFYVFPPLRRQIRLHKAYIKGEPTTFIQPQPALSDYDAQEIAIRLKRNPWTTTLFILLALCVGALLGYAGLVFHHQEPYGSIIEMTVYICVVLEFLVLASLPGTLLIASPSLRADSEGFILSKGRSVNWQDARIFARVGSYRRDPRLAYYELVDDKQSLTFAVALKPPSRFALVRPETSFEEYERQTQQLLGMIAVKTGLPLVDLRSR